MALKQQNSKTVVFMDAQSATNAGTITSGNIDTLGYKAVEIIIVGTTSDAATNNPSVFKIQESDITTTTGFADVTALVGDGTGGFTVPNSPTATTTNAFAKISVDLRGRKRYLRMLISPLTSQTYTGIANLYRGQKSPTSATDMGAAVVVNA